MTTSLDEREKLVKFKADFLKALANPLRIQIIDELRDGELTVTELKERLHKELPNISQQLSVLKTRHLVVSRKQGTNTYYSCTDPAVFRVLDAIKEVFNNHLIDLQETLKKL